MISHPRPWLRRWPAAQVLRLTDLFLESNTELSIKSLCERVVAKKRHRCIHPCQWPRARKLARAAHQLRRHGGRRRVKYLGLVNVLVFLKHGARDLREHV